MYISTATVLIWVFIHLGVILVVCAYYALSAALAPNLTEKARIRFARRPWLPALIGLAASVPWVAASLILMSAPLGGLKFAGATLGTLWVLLALVGGAGIAQHIGQGSTSGGGETWVRSMRGGLFITLTWILPLVGWMIMLPLTLASGVGCLVLGMFPMRPQSVPALSQPIAA
jgi:hypothetical protein